VLLFALNPYIVCYLNLENNLQSGALHVCKLLCVTRCDAGFATSETCGVPDSRLPSMLVAPVSSKDELLSSFDSVEGAAVDYSCGVVSSGRAVVFNGPDQRFIETVNFNASTSRYM